MKAVVLIASLTLSLAGRGQTRYDPQEMLDRIADQLLATAEADVSYDELYEALTHLLANPVDINTVTREQLRAIMLLNESEINAFLEYRGQQGKLLHVLEVQAIPGWSEETVSRVVPFVFVTDPTASVDKGLLQRIAREKNQYAVFRLERTLEDKPGYAPLADSVRRYAGNPLRYYFRYRMVRPNDFSFGFTAEKDPGEAFSWQPSAGAYGFDFYSGHLQLMKKGRLENLVIGDFQCQFGQGLQWGSVFGLGKTAQTITGIRRSNLGILPYVSASESFYLRGLAATIRLAGPIRIHVLGSQKQTDATVEADEPVAYALQTSGLHRTPGEIATRGSITDRDLGIVLQYRSPTLDAGVIAVRKDKSHSVQSNATPYNQFRFLGAGYSSLGAYLNLSWGGLTLFSEYAKTLGHGNALTAGLLGNLTHKLEMAWLYRNFDRDYYAAYANALSESSVPQNEQGFYWGMKYTASRRLAFQGYLDYFRFPWLRHRIYQPSDGTEWLLRLDFSPQRGTNFFVQAREEVKVRNRPDGGNLYPAEPGTRRNIWLSGEFPVGAGLSLRSRLQGSQYAWVGTTTQGLALVQEATWKKGRWSVSVRYALFDTDDYENRQYVYEKDVWLSTSLPAYEGSGIRNYVLVHCAVSRWLDLWVRWARTMYADREGIGSGMEQIAGNAKNDIKFQVRIKP